ncbi:MAG: ribosome maturation factor RimM [Alphaproteobacteria bacterium]
MTWTPDKKVLVGLIVAPQGIKGQARVKCFLKNPKDLDQFKTLQKKDGTPFPKIKISYLKKEVAIINIQGVTDRTAVEQLKNTELFIDHSELPSLDDQTFYEADLVGLSVQSLAGESLGMVVSVQHFGAGPLLEVQSIHPGETVFVPFKDDFVPVVELKQGFLQVEDSFADQLKEEPK